VCARCEVSRLAGAFDRAHEPPRGAKRLPDFERIGRVVRSVLSVARKKPLVPGLLCFVALAESGSGVAPDPTPRIACEAALLPMLQRDHQPVAVSQGVAGG
jgi:hypothetical protein